MDETFQRSTSSRRVRAAALAPLRWNLPGTNLCAGAGRFHEL